MAATAEQQEDGPPLTELESLQLKANNITDDSLESTRRMIQLCEDVSLNSDIHICIINIRVFFFAKRKAVPGATFVVSFSFLAGGGGLHSGNYKAFSLSSHPHTHY